MQHPPANSCGATHHPASEHRTEIRCSHPSYWTWGRAALSERDCSRLHSVPAVGPDLMCHSGTAQHLGCQSTSKLHNPQPSNSKSSQAKTTATGRWSTASADLTNALSSSHTGVPSALVGVAGDCPLSSISSAGSGHCKPVHTQTNHAMQSCPATGVAMRSMSSNTYLCQ